MSGRLPRPSVKWFELIGEPAMTLLDFSSQNDFEALDPSDSDFRIWLAWHDDPDRLYVAFVSSDDVYKNDHDWEASRESLRNNIDVYDSITLTIDGDHSGGKGCPHTCLMEDLREVRSRTQRYEAIARIVSGPTLDDQATRYITEGIAWNALPPYGQGGGGVAGEAPTISVIEFYVTPFDRFEPDDPEGSVVSDLAAGQVIGFAIMGSSGPIQRSRSPTRHLRHEAGCRRAGHGAYRGGRHPAGLLA